MSNVKYTLKKLTVILKITLQKIFSRWSILVLSIFLGFMILVLFNYSKINYQFGNTFFGEISSLYNVKLAQFFYNESTRKMVGKIRPYAYHQLSRTHFISGNLDKSIIFAYKELEIYPENKATYYIIGLTLGYMNREEEAIDAFTKYIEYNPITWAARNDKAWLQFRIGDIDGALATIEPVVNRATNPWVQNTYGTLLMNKQRYKEAESAFMKAQTALTTMNEETWGKAYPGNDPRIYSTGLGAMKTSIESNLNLVRKVKRN